MVMVLLLLKKGLEIISKATSYPLPPGAENPGSLSGIL
jgi:hypothetical protein